MTGLLVAALSGALLAIIAALAVRGWLVPGAMTRLLSGIPKTMRFDLATPQSMRNMVVLANPGLAPWFDEAAAGRMLGKLRRLHPAHPAARKHSYDDLRAVTVYPAAAPPGAVRLPAEHEALDGMLLAWPWHYPVRWAPHAALIRAITSAPARALIMTPSDMDTEQLVAYLRGEEIDMAMVDLVPGPVDDVWVRDFGPTFVMGSAGPAIIANAYAPGEHPYRKGDNASAFVVGAALGIPVHMLPMLVEGGNLVPDGRGTMVMTDAVLDRNPELDEAAVAEIVRRYFGCDRIIIIEALPAEVTGHADMVVRFVDPVNAVVASAPPSHRWAAHFDRVAARLERTSSSTGAPYRVHRLPIAASGEGSAFWSYVNCVQVNGTTIVPVFDDPNDRRALNLYRLLTDGPVVPVDFSDFLVGSAHCQTKEVPAGVLHRG